MKTEKRFAEIGERIITTCAEDGHFTKGQVFKVRRKFMDGEAENGAVYVDGMIWILYPAEYEVIVGEETEE